MDGIGAGIDLYGAYIERYMHKEEPVAVPPPENYEEEDKSLTYYDVTNPLKCVLQQLFYMQAILFFAFKEVFEIFRDVINRDINGKIR